MRIVVALGGNALLLRGEPVSAEAQYRNIRMAAAQLAVVAAEHDLVIVHGNGPQVGLLAVQSGGTGAAAFPLDVLDAETEGMIGYQLELELRNLLPPERACATVVTMVEVERDDPAFAQPDKPIGAMLDDAGAIDAARAKGWSVARDGNGFRRVVASPQPRRFVELQPVRWLIDKHAIVICAGGGGIPVVADAGGRRHGVEAVIDKDRSAAVLAEALEADLFVIATDVDGVYLDWGTEHARRIARVTPGEIAATAFAAGSMGPKVEAACAFATRTRQRATIGALAQIEALVAGAAGTHIVP